MVKSQKSLNIGNGHPTFKKNNPSKKCISTNTVGLMTIPYHTEAVGLDRPCHISNGMELLQINHGLGPPNKEAAVVIHLG